MGTIRKRWTKEEIKYIENMYLLNKPLKEIADHFNVSDKAISSIAKKYGISQKYIKPNNTKYKAIYQEYDWCFDRFVNKGMSHQEMADELGVSKRVIQKWCVEIHHIDTHTYKKLKHLTNLQRRVAIAGTLGDGHISQKDHAYIESHAIDEKDYLFWKYSIFKDVCNQEPTYYESKEASFGTDKKYKCKPFYRFSTRNIDEFEEIRIMPKLNKIKMMDELMFCLYILDDGSRHNLWDICLAGWNDEEKNEYMKK